jgi:gliding motility-associated-like protein
VNQPYCYNIGAVDPDNDSLVFQLIQPRTSPSGGCSQTAIAQGLPFTNPNSFNLNTNPFATGNTFTLNSQTGQICFTATQQQYANVAILVKEYRGNVLVGTTMRDIQVVAIQCTSQQPAPPAISTNVIGAVFNNGRIEGCTGQPLNFCFDVVSPDTTAVLVPKDNHIFAAPGSIMTYTGFGTDSVRGCLSWTPGPFDTGTRQLTVIIKDSTCTPPGIPISQSFNIPLYIFPTATILRDTAICQGDSVNLIAVGGSTFTWSVMPGGSPLSTLSCTNCKNPTAKPQKTTNYIVTTNLQSVCNKNKDTVTIIVPEAPDFDAGPDTTTCINSSIQMNINLVPKIGTQYKVKWAPATGLSNDTITNPIAHPLTDTRYIITVTPGGLNACAKKDTVNVKVIKGYTIANPDTAICIGGAVVIRGVGDNRYGYTWTSLPSTPATISNPGILTTTLSPTNIGITTYTVTAKYPGCIDSVHKIKVDVQPPPTVNVGADRILCSGDTAHLHSTVSPAYPGYIYTWLPGGLLNNNSIPDPIFSAQTTTKLALTVRTTAGCKGSDTVVLTVVPANYLTVRGDTAFCPGGSAALKVTGPYRNFVWRPALWMNDTMSTTPVVTPIVSTTYSVYAVDSNGCVDTASVFVEVKPGAVISLPDSVTLFPGDSVQFMPNTYGSNALYYSWFPPQGLSAINVANPVAKPLVDTRYFVTGVTEFGCSTTDSVDVRLAAESRVAVPNAFTPGNGANGSFRVAHEGWVGINYFRIYNRWGTLVFETKNMTEGWDGKYKDQPQPMGVYIYTVEAIMPSGRKFYQQGNVTLIR